MRLWCNLLWGRGRGPAFQEGTCVFLRIVRWHGPTAEERVARGPQQGVPKLGAMRAIAFL